VAADQSTAKQMSPSFPPSVLVALGVPSAIVIFVTGYFGLRFDFGFGFGHSVWDDIFRYPWLLLLWLLLCATLFQYMILPPRLLYRILTGSVACLVFASSFVYVYNSALTSLLLTYLTGGSLIVWLVSTVLRLLPIPTRHFATPPALLRPVVTVIRYVAWFGTSVLALYCVVELTVSIANYAHATIGISLREHGAPRPIDWAVLVTINLLAAAALVLLTLAIAMLLADGAVVRRTAETLTRFGKAGLPTLVQIISIAFFLTTIVGAVVGLLVHQYIPINGDSLITVLGSSGTYLLSTLWKRRHPIQPATAKAPEASGSPTYLRPAGENPQ
jgi:hypothetical protein